MNKQHRKWGVFIPPMGAARQVMHNAVSALAELGEQFTPIDTLSYENSFQQILKPEHADLSFDMYNQSWVCKAIEEEWTHVLVGALSPVNSWTLRILKKLNITRVIWFYEDYRKAAYWREQINDYDLFCAIQKGELEEAAGDRYRYLPTGALPSTARIHPAESRAYDIAFIGIPSTYRIEILEQLVSAGVNVAIAGEGWEKAPQSLQNHVVHSGWIDEPESIQLYGNSRMGLNISQESPWDERGNSVSQISPRLYELAAYGTFPVTEDLPLGDHIYSDLELIRFRSVQELLTGITRLLNEGISYDIYHTNRTAVLSKHLYTNRIKELISWVSETKQNHTPQVNPGKTALFTTCDENYVVFTLVAFESFRRFNPDIPCYLFGIFENRERVEAIGRAMGVEIISIDEENYPFRDCYHIETGKALWPKTCFGYFTAWEHLYEQGIEHALYIDADVFCNKPVDYSFLIEQTRGISGVTSKENVLNSGVLFFNIPYLKQINFTDLAKKYYSSAKICNHDECDTYCHELGDQELLALIIKEENLLYSELDNIYNYFLLYPYERCLLKNKRIIEDENEVVLLHIMLKPWLPEASQVTTYPLLQYAYQEWQQFVTSILPKLKEVEEQVQ